MDIWVFPKCVHRIQRNQWQKYLSFKLKGSCHLAHYRPFPDCRDIFLFLLDIVSLFRVRGSQLRWILGNFAYIGINYNSPFKNFHISVLKTENDNLLTNNLEQINCLTQVCWRSTFCFIFVIICVHWISLMLEARLAQSTKKPELLRQKVGEAWSNSLNS